MFVVGLEHRDDASGDLKKTSGGFQTLVPFNGRQQMQEARRRDEKLDKSTCKRLFQGSQDWPNIWTQFYEKIINVNLSSAVMYC